MLLSRIARAELWRHEYVALRSMPVIPAPGLERYSNAITRFKELFHRGVNTERSGSLWECGIVGTLVATGNWETGAFTIIDGFRRIPYGTIFNDEVGVRIYNDQHLHDPADILRLRLSINADTSSATILSEALAIHSVWTSVVLKNRTLTRSAERRILEAAARNDAPTTETVEATRSLFKRARVNLRRFTYTLHPLVHYPQELQHDMFLGAVKPSLAKIVVAGSTEHVRAELHEAARTGASRSQLEDLKRRLE